MLQNVTKCHKMSHVLFLDPSFFGAKISGNLTPGKPKLKDHNLHKYGSVFVLFLVIYTKKHSSFFFFS
jgi:hypothetical protein